MIWLTCSVGSVHVTRGKSVSLNLDPISVLYIEWTTSTMVEEVSK